MSYTANNKLSLAVGHREGTAMLVDRQNGTGQGLKCGLAGALMLRNLYFGRFRVNNPNCHVSNGPSMGQIFL